MIITQISIRKQGYWGSASSRAKPETPYDCTVEVQGQSGKTELSLSPDMTKRIMAVIGDELVASTKRTAEAMTAEIITVAALPAPETKHA